jgi:cation diffusion facilitator CzcD-associated flavoprotein CzcO
MPATYPLDYLERYAARFDVKPVFGVTVSRIARDSGQWRVETADDAMMAPIVVVATGIADSPHRPSWPGLENYSGTVVHSSEYRNPAPFAGRRVLVVGFGNSGGEIALDLADAGVDVMMAVRSPVQIIPRDLLGLPIMSWILLYRRLPARLVDLINRPVLRLAVGDFEKFGLRRAAKGPRQMVEEDGRMPLIDIGTLAKIRNGSIRICGGSTGSRRTASSFPAE